ncbi:DUF5804 family protein [Natronococcus occultus]|uniref:Uncharacterized protein n=1 Tax=Natronococcus occultus SP4 TaxID=694430 RepID=L0JZT3_9EURY|nr:DUF5804 family protein [Natronococcus occultus]AGB37368.1 hypothetical protein Natoc_1561 [Natronococcus occultus SP4]
MTRVCLVGDPEVNLQYELLSRETSREALATYDLERPFENSLAVRTVSVGAAISLLNDLDWYLTRFVDEALVREPSVSGTEWLSRSLADELRNGVLEADDTGEFCKIYGLERPDTDPNDDEDGTDGDPTDASRTRPRLVEPLYVRRTDGDLPEYDLRDVAETLVVRLTEAEYSP